MGLLNKSGLNSQRRAEVLIMGYLVVLCLLTLTFQWSSTCKVRVCYYTNWAQYRDAPAKFMPEDIDTSLCTHIIYAFAIMHANHTIKPFEWNDMDTAWGTKGMYARVVDLKRGQTTPKVLLAIGGWNFASKPFSDMVATAGRRKAFINSAIKLIRSVNFDGLDLDWEYPTQRGGIEADKDRFTLLSKELMKAFQDEAKKSSKPRLLLTVALPAGKNTIDAAYDVPKIHQHFDFLSIMAYDYHGGFDQYADHNSPLYSLTGDVNDFLTVNFTVEYYLQLGIPKEKLVVGLATYGRTGALIPPVNKYINGPISGEGPAGKYTKTDGVLAYYEYCKLVKITSTIIGRHGENPYMVYGTNPQVFLGYEDIESIKVKVKYALSKNLLGIMFWTLDLDDFNGKSCDQGKYPLIKAANAVCDGGSVSSTKPNNVPARPTAPAPTTKPAEKLCTEDGLRDNPKDCKKYIQCHNGNAYDQSCPAGLVYKKSSQTCDWPGANGC